MRNLRLLILSAIMSSCYLSKPLDRDVHVELLKDFHVMTVNNGKSSFTDNVPEDTLKMKFLEGMSAEFKTSRVIVDNNHPEFIVSISSLQITESTKTQTVDDSTSNDNGKKFELSKLEFSAEGTIKKLSDPAEYKEEKLTSLQSMGQAITGQNKDMNEYREKEFEENEAALLSWNCGRRSGNSVVRELIKSLEN